MSYNKKLYYYYYLKRCDINVTVKLHKYMNFCPITELIYPDHIPNHIPENISSDVVYNFIFSYILLPHLPTMLKWCILPYFIYNITEDYTTKFSLSLSHSFTFSLKYSIHIFYYHLPPTEKNNLNFSKLYCNNIIEQRLKHTNKK